MFKEPIGSVKDLAIFIVSIISFLLVALDSFSYFYIDPSPNFTLPPFFKGFLIAVFLLTTTFVLQRLTSKFEFFNIEELFGYILAVGMVAMFVNILHLVIDNSVMNWQPSRALEFTLTAFSLYLLIIFFITCLVFFQRLIFVKKTIWIDYLWTAFLILLATANVFNFREVSYPEPILFIYLGTGILIITLLIFRINWIALLSQKVKYLCILFLVILSLISLGLTQRLWQHDTAYAFDLGILDNMPLILLIIFTNAYILFSLLALLFNLPISTIMEDKNNEIASFREISRIIESKTSINDILGLLFKGSLSNTPTHAGWIVLNNYIIGEEKILQEKGMGEDLDQIPSIMNANNYFVLEEDTNFLYIKDIRHEATLRDLDLPFRSMLIFSISINKFSEAHLYLLNRFTNGFDQYSIDVVLSFISQAKLSIANANLLQEALAAERFKKDVEIGKNIQRKMLPAEFPSNNCLDVAAVSISAEEVGGDYYDFCKIDDHRYIFLIGDVSGKGTSAAFHVAEMKGIFQSLILETQEPAKFLSHANTAVSNCFEKGVFITLTYLLIDTKKKKIKYSRAGHCPMIIYQKSTNTVLVPEDEGVGLGIVRNTAYKDFIYENCIKFETGDLLVLYTDGIVEAKNESGQEYGMRKLEQLILTLKDQPPDQIIEAIYEDILAFTADIEKSDDISILILKAR